MADVIPEAEAFINFKLNEMAAHNEHHEFEEIATRIARKRISSNILIATGPVSAGGDQQRDAETYTTRIPEELPHSAGFSASASTNPIVIACTVQKDRLKEKVLADLAGICSADADPVEHVAFFTVHNISEGITHDLKKTARETYGVSLDIFCGPDIATFLAEPDLVWVARHYLDMPSSLVPSVEENPAPEWYSDILENLRHNNGPAALTHATQGEISYGLRHATFNADANADLPEWLDFMSAFLSHQRDGKDTNLTFTACYEIAIARFRGMGGADGVEDLIRRAVAYAYDSEQPNVIDDAIILASYWGVMWSTGLATAEATEIGDALDRLRAHARDLLETTDPDDYPIRAATLAGSLAYSYLIPDWRVNDAKYGRPTKVNLSLPIGVQLDPGELNVTNVDEAIDVDNAMLYLDRLVDLLPVARAYSATQLATLFDIFTPVAIDHPSYSKVRDGLDEATARVQGEAAVGERHRDRGAALIKAGKILEGLVEEHQAKVNWFNGDTMYGAILTMRYIAQLYAQLGLAYAAKMYACNAAVIALAHCDQETKEQGPKALLEAARYAQMSGTWADAAGLTEVAMLARGQHLSDPFDFDKHPDLHPHQITQALGVTAVRDYWPELEQVIRDAHWAETGWYTVIEELLGASDNVAYDMSEGEYQKRASNELLGPIFSDLGPDRIVDFEALGVRWIFTFASDKTTVLTAEGLCAAFQVFLADIALRHPVVLSGTVHVFVDVRDDAGHEVDDLTVDDSSNEFRVHITLSSAVDDRDAHAASIMTACFQLVDTAHAGASEDLQAVMEPMYLDGLPHKLVMGRSYQDAADLLKSEHYERCSAAIRPASSAGFRPSSHDALRASTAPGASYDRAESLQAIHRRYEFAYTVLRYTYPRLLADPTVRASIEKMRADGWLDWQILAILGNLRWNWRLREAGIRLGEGSPQEANRLAREPETPETSPVPLDAFDEAALAINIQVQTLTIAQTMGLHGRTEHRDEGAMRDLLNRRFGFGTDDVPHRDVLNDCLGEDGELLPFVVGPAPTDG